VATSVVEKDRLGLTETRAFGFVSHRIANRVGCVRGDPAVGPQGVVCQILARDRLAFERTGEVTPTLFVKAF